LATIRQRKIADRIKQLVSEIIDRKVKDPQKGFITITHVKISGDLRIASIYFTVLGDSSDLEQSLEALNRAKNFIRSEIAHHLEVKFVPEIRFFVDDTMEYARKIDTLLKGLDKNKDES
jgi:ribosome-binding factor A